MAHTRPVGGPVDYRPIRATQGMVAWTERAGRTDLLDDGYIARRSRHNLGLAVDLTLVDLATRRELPMGTAYDAFTEAAHTANSALWMVTCSGDAASIGWIEGSR